MDDRITLEEIFRQGTFTLQANDTLGALRHPQRAMDDLSPDEAFTVRFKEWRKFRKLNQQQLADKLGTTSATISRRETGSRKAPMKVMVEYARALECEPADLLRPPSEFKLASLIKRMPPTLQAQALRIVEAMAEPDEKSDV